MAAATIRDVAKRAGVGVGTVSRVLNNNSAVSDPTRQKVLAAIEFLNFSPNLTARRLSLGKTLSVGVIVPFFTNPSYVERLRGIESVLSKTEYDMILFNVETAERRTHYFRDVPRRERVDGLIVITLTPDDEDATRFARAEIATVLIDAYHPQISHVMIDNVAGGYNATRHLISLGHSRIGFISDYLESPFNFMPVRDRFLGYYQALEEADIPFRPEYHRQGQHGRFQARQMAQDLLALPQPPTAIFAYSDTQAIGVLEAAVERGLQVPQDLSVMGFDDIEMAAYFNLTTVRQYLFESGIEGGKRLLQEMEGLSTVPYERIMPTELVVRETTAAPNTEKQILETAKEVML